MPDRRDRIDATTTTYKSTLKLAPAIGDWTTIKPVRTSSKKVKTGLYGFDKLSQEELKLAHTVHYNYGQAILSSLKKNLSIGGDLFTISAEQATYSDFLKKVYQPTVYCKIAIPNLSEEVIVCVDMPIANTIINFALGGKDLAPITRKLTKIEEEVFLKAIDSNLEGYTKAFENIFESPKLKVISSPELTLENTVNPTGTFIFFTIEISVGDNPPATIWIGYTSTALKILIEKVKQRISQRPVNFSKFPSAILDGINIPIIVDLGQTAVATQDLHRLEQGDVVSLDTNLADFVPIFLGGSTKVMGQPGVRSGKLSVRPLGAKSTNKPIIPEQIEEANTEDLSLENKEQGEYPMEEEEFKDEAEE